METFYCILGIFAICFIIMMMGSVDKMCEFLNSKEKQQEAKDNPVFSEIYAKTWADCRNFVLPMNPVRRELEYAVKSILNELGLSGSSKQKKETKKTKKSKSAVQKDSEK